MLPFVIIGAMLIMAGHMLIHELGHVVAAWAAGASVKRLGVSWAGLYIKRSLVPDVTSNVLIALSGPLANLATWAVLGSWLRTPYFDTSWCPLFLAAINLLPIADSDLSKALCYIRNTKSISAC